MSATTPKATVLISTYNRPDYLREAIQSVVNQRMDDWELLIMNDGGADVSHVINEFNDPRIRFFDDDTNRGAAYRFNFGLQQARGDYIAYLGDDDLFYPNHLEVLSRALDENPQVAVAYSDLYAVSFIKDETNGKRHVVDKRIQVSRRFNRQFMFHFNHVLHVSMLHRREAGLRVGGYDPTIKVVIEWCLTRKFCFIYDFLYVPVVTGEYYMPMFKSDRISVVQRKNKHSYRQNIRKIKASLPPEPWPKVDRVAIILPVFTWDDALANRIGEIYDLIDHPFKLYLVNNGTGLSEEDCRERLGQLAELKNLTILTTPHRLDDLDAYRFGAQQAAADYVFLLTDNFQAKIIPKRLIGGLEYLHRTQCDGVKWEVPEEKRSNFDLLIKKNRFLKRSDLSRSNRRVNVHSLTGLHASGYRFDVLLGELKRQYSQGEYEKAYAVLQSILQLEQGAPGIEFMIDWLVKLCLKLKKLDLAERECRALIARGYEDDNWIRLGQILQAQKRSKEAIEAYSNGLEKFHLKDTDLDSPVFPFNFPKELSAFTALMGQGECCYEIGDYGRAAASFRRASKLRANSHKPFLWFAKLFLASNQLDQAEGALAKVGQRDGKDPETHRILGKLCERRKRPELAFSCYLKAFDYGKTDEENLNPIYYTGARLGRWDDLKRVFEEFIEKRPDHIDALARLSSVYLHLGDAEKAEDTARRGLKLDGRHPALQSIMAQARKNEASGVLPRQASEDKAL